ncbi:LysR family transcriptional regulator [Kingella denitrificans]|jgi:transcriptional regulator, lysR family|uniref:Transcriptional regulator, LysR family n=1 Tax=Kingella denitrificans ATCC 33394 TaxID=888741 RepID=F0F2P4_9NEIS|nr:LysR family transcriptional regulator [Kingella denitrificans]EGC16221.1 transcriptional regulator, LysR family [Kingella denitrificans ATCC 33394]QQB42729.1 LysR family transcriptional regulator [Kingella denitrificans]RKW30803.1 MAG: LysR family transcriptional regulator [Kingella sp. (in: b-proteobacteria)]STR11308.1 Hca operon transcriptional activator [Kingella denitrificans]
MDIQHLKAFIAVACTKNLTQAAEKLFLSQPAVSAQIKALESDVGTALFVRTNNGMQLTRAGEVLLPEAEALLQHKHRLEQFAQTLSADYVHSVQLGIIHPIESRKVTALTRCIVEQEPKTQLHIHYGMSIEILSRLLAKKIHAGFFLGHIDQRNLQVHFLEHVDYSLICPQSQLQRIRDNLPKSLNDSTWIEMSGISSSYKNLQQFWHRHKLNPKKQIICDYPQTIIDLAVAQQGLAMVPKHSALEAVGQGKDIAVLDEFEQHLPLHFIYLDEFSEDPAVTLLLENVQRLWKLGAA